MAKRKKKRRRAARKISPPRPPIISVDELIDKAKPERIVEETVKRGGELTLDGVRKWRVRGIPDRHWDILIALTGVSAGEIYAINQRLRRLRAA